VVEWCGAHCSCNGARARQVVLLYLLSLGLGQLCKFCLIFYADELMLFCYIVHHMTYFRVNIKLLADRSLFEIINSLQTSVSWIRHNELRTFSSSISNRNVAGEVSCIEMNNAVPSGCQHGVHERMDQYRPNVRQANKTN